MAIEPQKRNGGQDRPSAQVEQARSPAEFEERTPLYRRPALWIGVCLLIVILLAVAYWLHSRKYVSTDDAFVDGNIVQVSARVPGQTLSVEVDDNQDVGAGTVLVRIDPKDLQAQLDEAQAALAAAKAKLKVAGTTVELIRANTAAALTQAGAGVQQAEAAVETSKSKAASSAADVAAAQAEADRRQADLKRYKSLDPRAISRQQLDDAQAAADASQADLAAVRMRAAAAESMITEAQQGVAEAQGVLAVANTGPEQVDVAIAQEKTAEAAVKQAQAAVDAAELNLSYTTITAPVAGRVSRRIARPGQYLQVGQIILALVEPDVWVTANFKETDLTHMTAGQDVQIEVDAYPGHVFRGKVNSIQAGSGARFSLLPPENATGNYVKVVQRVPVKITFDPGERNGWLLAPGLSVVPWVRIGTGAQHPRPILLPLAPSAPRGTNGE